MTDKPRVRSATDPDPAQVELDAAIRLRAANTPIREILAHRGDTTVGLREDGAIIEYAPDGTTAVLSPATPDPDPNGNATAP
jgi:hypothetical protein